VFCRLLAVIALSLDGPYWIREYETHRSHSRAGMNRRRALVNEFLEHLESACHEAMHDLDTETLAAWINVWAIIWQGRSYRYKGRTFAIHKGLVCDDHGELDPRQSHRIAPTVAIAVQPCILYRPPVPRSLVVARRSQDSFTRVNAWHRSFARMNTVIDPKAEQSILPSLTPPVFHLPAILCITPLLDTPG